MGILSEERYNEMVSRLEGNEPSEDEAVEAPEVSADSSEPSEDVKEVESDSSSDTEDVKEEVETQAESEEVEAPKTPEHIPYSRFKEVNDKFRARDNELEQAMSRIRELEQLTLAQAKQPQQPQPAKVEKTDDEWLAEIFGEQTDPSSSAIKQMHEEMQAVKQWQQERTEQLVTSQLTAEINAAVEKNPDVKAAELWQAVAADGSVDVAQAAEYIQNHRKEMRDQYRGEASKEIEELKAKLAQAEKAAQEQPKFRRPSATASAPPPVESKSRNIADATAAFAEALKERASF